MESTSAAPKRMPFANLSPGNYAMKSLTVMCCKVWAAAMIVSYQKMMRELYS